MTKYGIIKNNATTLEKKITPYLFFNNIPVLDITLASFQHVEFPAYSSSFKISPSLTGLFPLPFNCIRRFIVASVSLYRDIGLYMHVTKRGEGFKKRKKKMQPRAVNSLTAPCPKREYATIYVVDYIGYWLYGNTHVCLYCVGLPGRGCIHTRPLDMFFQNFWRCYVYMLIQKDVEKQVRKEIHYYEKYNLGESQTCVPTKIINASISSSIVETWSPKVYHVEFWNFY